MIKESRIIVFGALFLAALVPFPSAAATMDETLTCSLVYGALFEAARRSQHEGMMQYSRPRLQAVLPYMQENKENPSAKRRLREIATDLESELRHDFVQQVSAAINEGDTEKLKASMTRVFRCDKAFGLSTLPLPIHGKSSSLPNKYLEGFQSGCLAKQRSAASPLPDAQIKAYCTCMTEKASARGVDGRTSEAELGQVIQDTHGQCLARIQ